MLYNLCVNVSLYSHSYIVVKESLKQYNFYVNYKGIFILEIVLFSVCFFNVKIKIRIDNSRNLIILYL